MTNEKIKGNFTIEKMHGKGGWSYVILPNTFDKSGHPFGWKIVKGTIDGYPIVQYKLWPTKYGELFLPIKSQIRKAINKKEGDTVHIELFADDSELDIPDDLMICLEDNKEAKDFFDQLSNTSKKQYIDWIFSAKGSGVIADRMAKSMKKMALGKKWHQS